MLSPSDEALAKARYELDQALIELGRVASGPELGRVTTAINTERERANAAIRSALYRHAEPTEST